MPLCFYGTKIFLYIFQKYIYVEKKKTLNNNNKRGKVRRKEILLFMRLKNVMSMIKSAFHNHNCMYQSNIIFWLMYFVVQYVIILLSNAL